MPADESLFALFRRRLAKIVVSASEQAIFPRFARRVETQEHSLALSTAGACASLSKTDLCPNFSLTSLLCFMQHRPLTDSVSRNALTKFTGTLTKRFPERASVMDEADFAEFEQLHSSVAFLEEIKQENEEKNGDEDGAEEEMVNVAQTKAAAGRGRGRGRGKATTRGRGRGARAG